MIFSLRQEVLWRNNANLPQRWATGQDGGMMRTDREIRGRREAVGVEETCIPPVSS